MAFWLEKDTTQVPGGFLGRTHLCDVVAPMDRTGRWNRGVCWTGAVGVSPPPATVLRAPCAEDETLDLLFLV